MKIYTYKSYKCALPFFISLLLLSGITKAQNQNCLDFDGINDVVTVPAASALISGATGISMTCWVYPTNNASAGFPDFDGFAGFRNEVNADFYLIQLAPSLTLEARFRNSIDSAFTLSYNGLQLNTWQHLALTYDGIKLRLYKNGIRVDSMNAFGTISNTLVNFLIGSIHYTSAEFYLDGKVDEVSLWNRMLTAPEVKCIYNSPIDTTMNGLKLYYRFNQGNAGLLNTSVTSAIDASRHINGTLSGFALSGTTSNWVAGVNNVTSQTANICIGQTYTFGTQTLSASGIYQRKLNSSIGCDSIIELTLHVTDTTITQTSTSLHANQNGATYQWLNCNTGYSAVAGATGQHFLPPGSGSYAVKLTINGCTDTSSCRQFNPVGIAENSFAQGINMYPNPVENALFIDMDKLYQHVTVLITDIAGKELKNLSYPEMKNVKIDVSDFSSGVYFMQIGSQDKRAILRFLKK